MGGRATVLARTRDYIWRDANGNLEFNPQVDPTGSFVVAGAYESGLARVIVLGDNAFQDSAYEGRNNGPLMRAILRWLTATPSFIQHDIYLPSVMEATQTPEPRTAGVFGPSDLSGQPSQRHRAGTAARRRQRLDDGGQHENGHRRPLPFCRSARSASRWHVRSLFWS